MKHIFSLFMLFALGATELTAKPVSSRKSKMRKNGARNSRKAPPWNKRALAKKSGKKPKSRQPGNIFHSSKRKRRKKNLQRNPSLSVPSNTQDMKTKGPEFDFLIELERVFNNADPHLGTERCYSINKKKIKDKFQRQKDVVEKLKELSGTSDVAKEIYIRYQKLLPWRSDLMNDGDLNGCSAEISRLHFFTAVFGDIESSSDVPKSSRLKELATALYASDGISADTISSALTKEKLTSVFLGIAKSVAEDVINIATECYRYRINNSFDPNSASQTFTKTLEINPMDALRKKQDDDIDWNKNDENYWSEQFQKWFFPGFTGKINIRLFLKHKKEILENKESAIAEKEEEKKQEEWFKQQYNVENNGVSENGNKFNCGVISVFSKKISRKEVAVKIANSPEVAPILLSGKQVDAIMFCDLLEKIKGFWSNYKKTKPEETIADLTIKSDEMIKSIDLALAWANDKKASNSQEKPLSEFLQDFFSSTTEAKSHESHLHQALILAPNPNVGGNSPDTTCDFSLRGNNGGWLVVEADADAYTDTEMELGNLNLYFKACAVLAKANILLKTNKSANGIKGTTILVPYVDPKDPRNVTLNTVVMQHTGHWHYTHFEPDNNREGVKKNEAQYVLGNKSPHALYQLNDIPFAKRLLDKYVSNQTKNTPNASAFKELQNKMSKENLATPTER